MTCQASQVTDEPAKIQTMAFSLTPATDRDLMNFQGLKGKTPSMSGSFIADSERVVMKLLTSGLPVESLLATAEWYERRQENLQHLTALPLLVASKEAMQSLVGYDLHQGVMARAPRPSDIPLAELAQGPMVILDGVAKTENVGAVVRNAAAFGVRGMLVGHDTCHPYNRRAVRASMGNVFAMKVHQATQLTTAIQELKAMGVTIYAFENRPFARALNETVFSSRSALLFGSEGKGLSQEALELADHCVRIPIDEEVYALNAACASAVGLYAFSQGLNHHGTPR